MQPEHSATRSEVDALYRKVFWRTIPILIVSYIIAFVDRGNVGFAKLQFMSDLGFTEAVFGLGGGLFYLGYSLFEVPSNLILAKTGARLTLLRIMVLWGACSAALALMSTPTHFYVLRSLLGAAEAGFFPGVLFYLTTWIPASRRARFTAMFMSAIGISGVISGPISGAIMQGLEGVAGLRGWQWMFIAEGIPAILMGVIAYLFLADRPSTAKWLSPREREIVEAELESEAADKKVERHASFLGALTDLRVYSLVAMSICLIAGGAGISLWLPTIVKQSGVANVWYIGLLSAIPWAVAIIGQQLWARRSDRIGERRWHAAIPAFLAGLGWILLPSVRSSVPLSLVLLTVMTTGYLCATGPFWAMPARFLSGAAAAGGIALITTAGSIAAFFAPTIVGWVSSTSGSLSLGQYFYGALMMLGAVIMLAGTRTLSIHETSASARSLAKA